MQTAKNGDTVLVHYKGTLEDGTVFDTSEGQDPIEFTIGERQVIEGFENAVTGMTVGETKKESIPADQAYGTHEDDLVFEVSREAMQPGLDLEIGDFVTVRLPDGQSAPMRVASLSDESVTLDANHPLAGKTLLFELQLIGIR